MPVCEAPESGGPLALGEAEDRLRCICFKTGPPRTVGVEVEWFVHDLADPYRPVSASRLGEAVARLRTLPLASPLTLEPGGQLELSSPPAASLMECVTTVSADLAAVRGVLRSAGLVLTGAGTDPYRPQRDRLLREPRYDAMEAYLDRSGPAGRAMMRDSASVQVCLDAGYEAPGPQGYRRRWRLAHLLGPVLVAAFANSPVLHGRSTGHRSTRQGLWTDLDPLRGLAPDLRRDPRSAWTAHALDTPVMCVRGEGDGPWAVPQGLTLRDWLRSGRPRPVTRADLDYHLTTLFPPVRPRGHLELRMIDAQPGEDGWIVPLAVVTALFDDPGAAEAAYQAVRHLGPPEGAAPPRSALWREAARHGLAAPALHAAALECFALAREALPRLGAAPAVLDAVDAFHERHVGPGRCPADAPLTSMAGTGRTGKDLGI
ncbi:ergothioneine biosynthesis glutamate--cysteine ligase EgtA [Streptomyces solincola]|uniref:Glutamate--cysteine ligase EgtA n=1 Tax=Streptomyces solincola TaxID=2100817 RepID=A0A2S9PX89_9ACTN|nr:ergothioneine biosynthesis glutamate--cysteine ligase EgtA [Streptomyces solincola]